MSPVADGAGAYDVLAHPRINASGMVAFEATLDLGGGAGIFTGPDPIGDKVIQSGDALFGSTVTEVELADLDDAGRVAFEAHLADARFVVGRADPVPEASARLEAAVALLAVAVVRRLSLGQDCAPR